MSTINNHTAFNLGKWLNRELFHKKLMSPWGIAILVFMAVVSGFLAANDLFLIPFILSVALIGIIIVYYCFFQPLIGFYLVSVIAFFMFYPSHLIGFEISFNPGVEMLILFLFSGTVFKVRSNRAKSDNLFKSIVTSMLAVYFLYFIIQAFNPNVTTLSGWHVPFRRLIVLSMIFYIAYQLIDTHQKLKFFFKFWVLFGFIAAVYGCYQQWFGLLPMEMRYIRSIPGAYDLLFQGGQLRKFSFLSDVVSFGILSGSMAIFTLLWAIHEKNRIRKIIMMCMAFVMLLGMAYSGTRTTNLLLPAAIALYGIVTIQNKVTLIAVFISVLAIMFILFAPIHTNLTLNRIRTTFDSKDASLNLRDANRLYIQPYIYKHPIGGGLSTTGVSGLDKFPGHPLAGFPADSYLLRAALEVGWIGLALSLLLNLVFFYQGIYYYFRMRNPEYKYYIVLMMATIFPVVVTQYSQETVGQLPFAIFFFSCLSLITRVKEFDDSETADRLIIQNKNL
ncbi:MAG: O-antigen ligase family protein [Ferruginibacter sp.]